MRTFQIDWSDEDGCFIARTRDFPSLATHGEDYLEAINQLKFLIGSLTPEWVWSCYDQDLDVDPFTVEGGKKALGGKLVAFMRSYDELLRSSSTSSNEEVDLLLKAVDFDRLHLCYGIALVRQCFTVRHLLPSWRGAVQRLKFTVESRGEDVGQLLAGLL